VGPNHFQLNVHSGQGTVGGDFRYSPSLRELELDFPDVSVDPMLLTAL
jgi:hypothetical protein